ncbi:hypothetical protein IFM89_034776 [Coptis chinensis]|uniref:Uncharacterized protein n=1 Tax=Coptis chinensis TaxID=261450 RepID=A0A835HDC2_9MAGN|nr:hypothetical protein IFM89_034776 [Coptis chinensis]
MSGKKCFMIGEKELKITWSDTPQYWKWIPLPDSRFATFLCFRFYLFKYLRSDNTTGHTYDTSWADTRFGHVLTPALSSATRYEGQFPSERRDGWLEIELGDFYNEQGEDGVVEMSLQEVKAGYWKAELIVEGIEVRPKGIST